MEHKEVVALLLQKGCERIKGVKVKNVTVTTLDEYTRLGITIDKKIPSFIAKDDGTYEEGEHNVVFISTYAISSLMKEDDDAAFAANYCVLHPQTFNLVLSRATIEIVQERVNKDEEYRNPFADEKTETVVFDHDVIINHVVDIKFSDFGKKALDKIADKMMDM